jgi:hypothetical protein
MSKIPDYYQVKFNLPGVAAHTVYGVLQRYDNDAIKNYDDHKLLTIEDSITGKTYLVEEKFVSDITARGFGGEYETHINDEYTAAQALSDALPAGLFVGKLFRIPRGDGYAWYVVTKVNKKTVVIAWRGYCMDRWVDPILGYGGKLDRALIEGYVLRGDAARKLFTTCLK